MPDKLTAVSRNLTAYRVMATIVGVLLVVLCLISVPLANFDGSPMWGVFDSTPTWVTPGSDAQHVGELITTYLGVAHGWLYMIFLIAAFVLSRKAGWDLRFTIVTLVLGTVPILSFWAERRATRQVQELVDAGVPGLHFYVLNKSHATAAVLNGVKRP